MSQALYRKYRSRTLDEIVGQSHITSLLKAAIDGDKVSHAYLLTGPRGVGKTSIARIIAHEINGLPYDDDSQHLDIIEIDAASNNGVEDVRELREKVHSAPTTATKKIYIIDEVHMLSKPAFNALLKTLEEPPSHVIFIMATTDADKLPATIISRVQRFNFRTIAPSDAVTHLRAIAEKEAISIDDGALELIALSGRGSFRDSIGLLDQLQHLGHNHTPISEADVAAALGLVGDEVIEQLVTTLRSRNLAELSRTIAELEAHGAQSSIIAQQLISRLRQSIAEHPEELPLLDALLDVSASSHPYIKLLTVLATNSVSQSSVANQAAHHHDDLKTPKPSAPQLSDQPPSKNSPAMQQAAPAPDIETPTETPSKSPKTAPEGSKNDFDWGKLIAATNSDVALKSLLSKCGHEAHEGTLNIFAGSKFNAGRLKSAKQMPKLSAALQIAGFDNLTVVVHDSTQPPRDSQLANVAAIMGGGAEVELDDGS